MLIVVVFVDQLKKVHETFTIVCEPNLETIKQELLYTSSVGDIYNSRLHFYFHNLETKTLDIILNNQQLKDNLLKMNTLYLINFK
jgi:hypothetical protein